jgi:hypothetical protein
VILPQKVSPQKITTKKDFTESFFLTAKKKNYRLNLLNAKKICRRNNIDFDENNRKEIIYKSNKISFLRLKKKNLEIKTIFGNSEKFRFFNPMTRNVYLNVHLI